MTQIDDYIPETNAFGFFSKIYEKANCILQFLTVFINLFHLFILTRKQMRSTAVNILMIGICTADIIFNFQSLYETAIDLLWIPDSLNDLLNFLESKSVAQWCTSMHYIEQFPSKMIRSSLQEICRLTSIYLSVLMAVYRTLSVSFPMSIWVQKMSDSKSAVITIIGTVALWFGYTTSHYVNLRLISSMEYQFCMSDNVYPNNYTYILSLPDDIRPLSENSLLNGLTKAIPAVLYPIITIFLIIELRKIRIRRKKLQGQTSDNTTKLVFFMTLSFMFSEGLAGSLNLLSNHFFTDKSDIILEIQKFNYPIAILKTLNSMSHCFICILMSSGYRDTVSGYLCKKGEVIMVQEATSSGTLKSSRS